MSRFRDQSIDGIYTHIEIVLDFVEVALIIIGNRFGNIALADAIHIFRRDVQGSNHRVHRIVDALHDAPVFSAELTRVRPHIQLARHRRVDKGIDAVRHRPQIIFHRNHRLAQRILFRSHRYL